MSRTLVQWAFILAVLLGFGPAVASLLSGLRDAAGGTGASLFINTTPATAFLALGGILLAAAASAFVGARFFSVTTGVGCAGLVFAWAAWHVAPLPDLIAQPESIGTLTRIALETIVLGLLAVALVALSVAMTRSASGSRSDAVGIGPGPLGLLWSIESDRRREGPSPAAGIAAGLAAGAAVAVVAAYLVAGTFLKGQTVAAGIIAGLGCGAAAFLVASSMGVILTPMLPAAVMALVGGALPLVAGAVHGSGVQSALLDLSFFRGARAAGFDWAAGILLGVTLGMQWAGAVPDARSLPAEPATA